MYATGTPGATETSRGLIRPRDAADLVDAVILGRQLAIILR